MLQACMASEPFLDLDKIFANALEVANEIDFRCLAAGLTNKLILRHKVLPRVDVFSIDPTRYEGMKIRKTGQICFCPKPISFIRSALFQEQEGGYQTIPWIPNERKLKIFVEFSLAEYQLIMRNSQVSAAQIAKKTRRYGNPRAFCNMYKYAFLFIEWFQRTPFISLNFPHFLEVFMSFR
jgi:hypothetical protein